MTFTDISQIGMDQGRPQASRETANSRQTAQETQKGKMLVLRAYRQRNRCPCQDKGVSPAACGCATRRVSLTFCGLLVGGKANLS